MCGIAGILTADAGRSVPAPILRRMTAALAHRGPDGDGFHVEPGLGLGHRRLAIIDLEGGRQPLFNEDGSVAIVFNGEIYNHESLRAELAARGHLFRTRSDTEAIVHAWESWGAACLDRLKGMFAFALWDRTRQILFLARDRLGKKPLYYTWLADGTFLFASELRGLLQHPAVPRRLLPAAIDDYFALGYVPDPFCIYDGIVKLPAAHYLLLERRDAAATPRRYWQPHFAERPRSEAEAVAELRDRLADSVTARLIADVPLGAFLSGGVDSSAVVATMASLRGDPIATFTIGFDGEEDETPFAAAVARRYHTNHRTERVGAIDYIDAAREQAAMFGEPFADSSSVPTHRVSVMARQNVTVALSGDGGDELFAGYRRYRWHRITEAVRAHMPAPARRRLFAQLARIYPKLDFAPRWLRAKYTLTEISLDSALGYYRMLCKVHDAERRRLYSRPFLGAVDGHEPSRRIAALMADSGSDDPVQQAQYADINLYLVGDILTKVDRASMATSLEVRAPLLDHEFVEWALSLPSSLTLRRGGGKYVLKRAMAGRVPDANLHRAKQGFATALAGRFRGPGEARVRARLLGEAMRDCGLFDVSALARLIDAHAGGRDHSAAIWSLLVFEGFLAAGAGAAAECGRMSQNAVTERQTAPL
jgi:asparagine synthase (glutamine-hydrolysing)